MGKKTNSFDYKTLASYLLPKDILNTTSSVVRYS